MVLNKLSSYTHISPCTSLDSLIIFSDLWPSLGISLQHHSGISSLCLVHLFFRRSFWIKHFCYSCSIFFGVVLVPRILVSSTSAFRIYARTGEVIQELSEVAIRLVAKFGKLFSYRYLHNHIISQADVFLTLEG